MLQKPQIIRAKIRVLLTGGGSGGHFYPILAVAEALGNLALNEGVDLTLDYLGPIDGFYRKIFEDYGIKVHNLLGGKMRRYLSLVILLDIPKFFLSIFQALFKVWLVMPDVVFSKGGTGALPVVLAARFYRIPVIVHESDAIPGTSNFISGRRFAKKIGLAFQGALPYFDPQKAAWVGNPVRADLLYKNPPQADAKALLKFDPKKPLILVLGGSLGSQRINEFIFDNLQEILQITQVLHQTGRSNFEETKKKVEEIFKSDVNAQKSGYLAYPFLTDNLKIAYSAADLIVSRAGASTIFESAAFKKPMILIPLPESANGHQTANAYEFAKIGGGLVIEEENLLPGIFINSLKEILSNPEKLKTMGENSAKFFKLDAADILAKEILVLAGI